MTTTQLHGKNVEITDESLDSYVKDIAQEFEVFKEQGSWKVNADSYQGQYMFPLFSKSVQPGFLAYEGIGFKSIGHDSDATKNDPFLIKVLIPPETKEYMAEQMSKLIHKLKRTMTESQYASFKIQVKAAYFSPCSYGSEIYGASIERSGGSLILETV